MPADPQAKGVVERLQDFLERSFEPGRCFANGRDSGLLVIGDFGGAVAALEAHLVGGRGRRGGSRGQ